MDNSRAKPGSRRSPNLIPDEPPFLISGITNWRLNIRPRVWRPPADIYETEDNYVVRVEIAGMGNSEFSVTVNNNTLTVHGTRPDVPGRRAYHQMEIHFGEFSIEVEFPNTVDVEKVDAEYEDGFLTILLPKILPKIINIGDTQTE